MLFLAAACGRTADEQPTPASTSTFAPVASATASGPRPTATIGPTASATRAPTAPPTIGTPATHRVPILGYEITLPAHLTIGIFADGLGAPRFMAFDEQGTLFVTDARGRVLMLPDADHNGTADDVVVIASGLQRPHGITFHNGVLYVAETSRVSRVVDGDKDGRPETLEPVIEGLPADGGHATRTIRFGPDGLLYVSIGSSCNVCIEADPRRAAIVRYQPDGSGEELFAIGLRNAVGIAFHPETGELWATNNGRDGMGDDVPPETINIVTKGADFGWPRCHAGDIVDPQFGGDAGCAGVTPPVVTLQAHSAPLGLTFIEGDALGPAWDGALLVAFHGSWDRSEPTGYKVIAVPIADGRPTGEVLDFASGWLLPNGDRWGRPVDVQQAPDGSLLITDDYGGRIFRIYPSE